MKSRSEQLEAAALAVVDARAVDVDDAINALGVALALPADAHPNKARQLAEAWLLACEQAQDPTVIGSTCALIRAESALLEFIDPSPDRTQGHSVAGVDILRDTLAFVLEYPDFDPPHPYCTMIEQALAGQVPDLLMDAAYLRHGVKPPKRPAHVAAQADALAALAELVACKDSPSQGYFDMTKGEQVREVRAWAEARRVIAATSSGGKG